MRECDDPIGVAAGLAGSLTLTLIIGDEWWRRRRLAQSIEGIT